MINEVPQSDKTAPESELHLEQRVLALIESLAMELHPRRKFKATMHSSLQRDLGFDSLGLSELLLRTEKEFQLRLPDDLFGRLETPLDLVNEIVKFGDPAANLYTTKLDRLPEFNVETVPEVATTLSDVLDWHVRHNRDRPHILLSDGFNETDVITYGDLSEAAFHLAAAMRSWGLEPGEFVGIMLPTGREFFEIFFGVILAGAIPVPMYPPVRLSQLEEHLRRQAGILRNSEAALLVIPTEGRALAQLLGAQIETLRGVSTVQDLREHSRDALSLQCREDDLAMLQYTSGSTGDPKGVMLTHANLLANIRAMGEAINADSSDRFVSWLPLYHDLGLIGAWFGSLYFAIPVIVMSPLRFIVRPESWLWAIHRNSATLTAAPNFAFELCVNKIDDSAIDGLDLSSLRMIANGAEHVSADTVRRFTERFEPYGFKAEAMTPVYGLAENSVGLAFSAIDEKPIIDRVDRRALPKQEMAVPAQADDQHPMSFVSCGVPLPGNQIRIVDALGREVEERKQGRLEFKGPSSTRGYYRNPEKSRMLFHDGWLDSSDLAYVAEGKLFITGRVKDIIIKGGRNIYPEEIEEAVGNVTDIRKGCVAAFASSDIKTGSERLVVVAETRATESERRSKLEYEVNQSVIDILGMPADEIIIASPHTVPKTSSGKIRRSTMCELYEAGNLGQQKRALWLQIIRLGLSSGFPRLRRLARTIGDLTYAGWWWFSLIVTGAITWIAVIVLPTRSLRWVIVRSAARLLLRLMRIQLTVTGSERLAIDTGVLTANHSSYFDAIVLAAILPGEPTFIAKKELSQQYVAGPFLRRLGAQFADRAVAEAGVSDVEGYKELVRSGQKLVVFPESTFYRMPGLLQFRLGAFAIASGTDTLVLPIAITGTRSILRGEQWFPRRGSVMVDVLAPVAPIGRDFSATIKLRDQVREAILAHCNEPDLAEADIVFQSDDNEG